MVFPECHQIDSEKTSMCNPKKGRAIDVGEKVEKKKGGD
jgi:hypothetical protein